MENKLLQKFLIPLLAVISIIYAVKTLGKESGILLSDVCQQQSDLKVKDNCSLEIGNFSFFFTQKPKINLLKVNQKDDYEERIFFFPQVELKNKLKGIVEKLNKKYKQYNVYIAMVNRPKCGVQLTIRYDRNKIDLACEECESINLQNGVTFRLYNKEVIDKIRLNKEKPVLTVASI